jgi:hypothetical protein
MLAVTGPLGHRNAALQIDNEDNLDLKLSYRDRGSAEPEKTLSIWREQNITEGFFINSSASQSAPSVDVGCAL